MESDEIKLNDLNYDDIRIGDVFSFERFIGEKNVSEFANLTSDYNPLHMDEDYAKKTQFRKRISHGMLIGSFFSALVGMLCPGKRCLYLSQTLNFKKPLMLNSAIVISGRVTQKFDAVKVIELKTEVRDKNGVIIVDGIARVKVRKN